MGAAAAIQNPSNPPQNGTNKDRGAFASAGSWYALRVRSNMERAVSWSLHLRDVAVFLPVYRETIRYSDRAKQVERLLFPGYLFSAFTSCAGAILGTPGVVHVLPSNLEPLEVGVDELASISLLCASPLPLFSSPLVAGQPVTIASGSLAGARGVVVRASEGSPRLVVNIPIFGRAVAVELDRESLESIGREPCR